MYNNCNESVRFCNPGFSSPRAAAAEKGFISVTNPVFPSPLPAERVGRTGDRVSGRFPTARLDSEDAQATVSKNLWILYAEVGRMPINLHNSGT